MKFHKTISFSIYTKWLFTSFAFPLCFSLFAFYHPTMKPFPPAEKAAKSIATHIFWKMGTWGLAHTRKLGVWIYSEGEILFLLPPRNASDILWCRPLKTTTFVYQGPCNLKSKLHVCDIPSKKGAIYEKSVDQRCFLSIVEVWVPISPQC